jgi:hypothetical protein
MYHQNSTTSGSTAVYTSFSNPQPSATITKGRGRLKTYGSNVYLKDGSNFEIELYNPKTTSVLAKIWINGLACGNAGIVLRPGQRVFLERFIDVAKKFKFTVYEVDDSSQTKLAIANNGKVEVLFYDEYFSHQPPTMAYYGSVTQTYTNTPSTLTIGGNAAPFLGQILNLHTASMSNSAANSIETGIVEKGRSSKQQFSNTYGNFNSWTCATSTWQILPESKKPVEMGEIRSYCTGCGTRHKKATWKFCPNCGIPVTE